MPKSLTIFKIVFNGVEVEGSKKKEEGEEAFNLLVYTKRGLT